MADNDLTVITADLIEVATRGVDRRGIRHQGILIGELPDIVPALAGSLTVYTIDSTVGGKALQPPTAGADYCRIRAWQSYPPDGKRLFFRKDNTAPVADGTNAEGYIQHSEGMSVKIADFTKFKMIVENGGAAYTVFVEWLLSTP